MDQNEDDRDLLHGLILVGFACNQRSMLLGMCRSRLLINGRDTTFSSLGAFENPRKQDSEPASSAG